MRRSWRLLSAWVAVALGGAMGVGGALMVSRWVSAPLATLVGGGVAAVSAIAAGRTRQWLERQLELRRELPDRITLHGRAGGLPRVRDITDPVVLGVHPAETRVDNPRQTAASGSTPYIPRDVDDELRDAVRREGLIVVVGESTAGKSRAAFEAIRALTPDHLLAVPSGRESLAAVVARLSESRRAILWLDDLERFLGPAGLTPAAVANLTARTGHSIILVATMRTSEYERFTARAEPTLDDQARSAWRASRDVLRSAHIIVMHRLWSATELADAATFADDSRIARALQQAKTFGIAETLAAGPELLRDWRNAWAAGSHPRGAALVAAAVDCRRAGLDDPVPRHMLLDLHHHYLLTHGGHALRPEPVDDAWMWALRRVHGASSLLIPAGASDEDQRYLAFDYLIDQPDHGPIPPDTWNLLIARADQSQALTVAWEAFWHVRTAFHAAIESGAANDVFARSSAMSDHGDHAHAIQLLADALNHEDAQGCDPEHRRHLRHQIAYCQLLSGRIDEAEATFRELLAEVERTLPPNDEYLQVMRHNLASCIRHRGDLPEALALFRRILADRERQLGPEAMNTLATRGAIAGIIAEVGDAAEAVRQSRLILADEERALGKDHTNTLFTRHSLANYLAKSGDPAAAIDVLQALLPDLIRALGADHPEVLDARWHLARYHGQHGDRLRAARQFQEVLSDRERIQGAGDQGLELARQELQDFLAEPA
ncbi:tetratricopeptide repeat protein [Actinoplanes sp. NPDC051411]|uniref:tetratricopeptide repeat protein n=1 Tax=Actinoplanes sp. NPDC051411 TaxID=3155522 RepID=UPI0034250326